MLRQQGADQIIRRELPGYPARSAYPFPGKRGKRRNCDRIGWKRLKEYLINLLTLKMMYYEEESVFFVVRRRILSGSSPRGCAIQEDTRSGHRFIQAEIPGRQIGNLGRRDHLFESEFYP